MSPPTPNPADKGPAALPALERARGVRALHAVNRLLCRVYHHVEVEGSLAVPRRGPMMIVSNHISGLDPLLVQSVISRPIVWMMAREYYEIPALRWVFESIRAIPVARDGKDTTALRAALRALDSGCLLGLFPEGKIATDRHLLPFQTGAAMMALRSKVPVLPVYQSGTTRGLEMVQAVVMPQQVRMRFGEAIDLPGEFGRTRDLAGPTERLETAVRELQEHVENRKQEG